MAWNTTWETFPASEDTITEHPNTYVVPIIYKAVSRKVDQNKFTYATMLKVVWETFRTFSRKATIGRSGSLSAITLLLLCVKHAVQTTIHYTFRHCCVRFDTREFKVAEHSFRAVSSVV